MIADFQEGRRPRPNAVASLAHTGHTSPLARRPGAGTIAHAHLPGAHRPGPQPMSARQTMAVNAQNARIKREIEQVAAECQRAVAQSNAQALRRAASVPLGRLDVEVHGDAQPVDLQLPGTYQTVDALRYRQGSLWIFATTLHDGWGDHVYFVFNPDTGALLEFRPESALPGHRGASHKAQVQAIAAYTGRVGGYLEKTYLAAALGGFAAAVAVEAGGYYVLTEQVAPFVARTAVSAYRIGLPLAQAAGRQVAKGFWTRVGTDLGIQLAAGFATGNGSALERGEQAARGVNGTSLLMSGVVNTEGLSLSTLGKWLVAGSSAVASNLVTVSADNPKKYGGGPFHVVDFHNRQQVEGFAFNVVLGMLLDRGREGLVEKATEKILARAAQANGRAEQAALRWVSATRVSLSLGLNLNMGTGFESGKKKLEQMWEGHNERVKAEEAEKLARTRMPVRPAVPAQPRPRTKPN